MRRANADFHEVFGDVLYLGGELVGATAVAIIRLQQFAVLFHHGAAAGGVGNDGVAGGVEHGVNVAPRQVPCTVEISGVRLQRAAAALVRRDDDGDAIAVQHADGGVVQLREGD